MILKWLRGIYAWFLIKPQAQIPRQYHVIEIEKPLPGGSDEAIASLKEHPGFIALLNKLRLQQAFLKSQLINNRQETIRDVDILVASIAGTRYLEYQVNAAVGRTQATPKLASLDEVELFNKISTAIESIGLQDRN